MALKISIKGVVQGVGFRPFVYNLAKRYSIYGRVSNSGSGVEIEAEADDESLQKFLNTLKNTPPPISKIESIQICEIEPKGYRDFEIIESKSSIKTTLISPDISTCKECLAEMRDPKNRRFGYPLINCTNCGSRYTIIYSLPYDRENTSMRVFKMCKECLAEYQDPTNRRYHAQPIGCFECGAKLSLKINQTEQSLTQQEILVKTSQLLKEGKIVAIKGLGGFHLVCDATNSQAVLALRERKKRPAKPFAVMAKSLKDAKKLAKISEKEAELLSSNFSPIVLLEALPDSPLAKSVAPDIGVVGVMLPYTPIHHLLFDNLKTPLVMTSANISQEPIISSSEELESKLSGVFDAVLDFDRDVVNSCDDSVAMVVEDKIFYLRVARGLAPVSTTLKRSLPKKVLALGANQKSTISIAFENKIITSAHIGDLGTVESVEFFEKNISILKRFYDFKPDILARDLHENYESSRWAKRQRQKSIAIQHHYAHTLAVMAEHNFEDEVLSFAWDGTGISSQKTIWGGEILLADLRGFKRVGYLREFKLLGGERAVKEPKRVALAMLFELFSLPEILEMRNPAVEPFSKSEIKTLHQLWSRGLNSPTTSSVGRFFDGVASLAGLVESLSYEGESGLKLEKIYQRDKNIKAKLKVVDEVIDWGDFVRASLRLNSSEISSALIESLLEVVEHFANLYPKKRVLLCGGVWQNRTLLKRVLETLPKDRLLLPKKLPLNDGAISAGQAYFARNF
jgi:hydrogenase maturation protein HypF